MRSRIRSCEVLPKNAVEIVLLNLDMPIRKQAGFRNAYNKNAVLQFWTNLDLNTLDQSDAL
jgi:hypothetical protein